MRARYLKYRALVAKQGGGRAVFMFSALASDVQAFARVVRAGRTAGNALQGFQRPRIALHVREIAAYLRKPGAVLPSAIVVALPRGMKVTEREPGVAEVSIDTRGGPRGLVVDGQQRLAALSAVPNEDFEVFVAVIECADAEQAREQFILINQTRPLSKTLVYELLPRTAGLPGRMELRRLAAAVTERLNFDRGSSLRGLIHQHTHPRGIIRDTAIQRVLMSSVSEGALRNVSVKKRGAAGYRLLNEFFAAVRETFAADWDGHTAKTSRSFHAAGIQALGFAMEWLVERRDARTRKGFARGLAALVGKTAWSSASWRFTDSESCRWDELGASPYSMRRLAEYLVKVLRAS